MKKNANVNKSAIPALSEVAVNFKAAADAKKLYEDTKHNVVVQLSDALATVPRDCPILNRDLARAAGVTPLHMANIIHGAGFGSIGHTTVTVTRRFAEVDENGKLVEGGQVKDVTSSLLAFYGNKGRW